MVENRVFENKSGNILENDGVVGKNKLGKVDCPNNLKLKLEYLRAIAYSRYTTSQRCAQAVMVCKRYRRRMKDDPCVKSICHNACGNCGCD